MEELYFYGNTTKGKLDKQEDAVKVEEYNDYFLIYVADGNGGQSGDINVGQLAINILDNYLKKIIQDTTSINEIRDSLDFGMFIVSQSLLSINAISERYKDIYSSMTLLVISKVSHKLLIASTGNTEVMLVRNANIQRLNRVFSETYEALLRNEILEKDFYTHPGRGVLTTALGFFPEVTTDILLAGELKEGDVILMTTDGIYRYLNPEQVISILIAEDTVDEGVDKVLKKINEIGGEDNASLIVGHLYNPTPIII